MACYSEIHTLNQETRNPLVYGNVQSYEIYGYKNKNSEREAIDLSETDSAYRKKLEGNILKNIIYCLHDMCLKGLIMSTVTMTFIAYVMMILYWRNQCYSKV